MIVGNDCIPYLNDLHQEILILSNIKEYGNCNNEEIDKKIQEKQELINKCKENLSKMSNNSIEYRLYLKLLNGISPTKAIQEIAEENYINDTKPTNESYIFRTSYEKIKKLLKVQ